MALFEEFLTSQHGTVELKDLKSAWRIEPVLLDHLLKDIGSLQTVLVFKKI